MTVLTPPPPPPRIPLREMAAESESEREIESGEERGRKIIESRERFIIIEALSDRRPPRSLQQAHSILFLIDCSCPDISFCLATLQLNLHKA